MFVLSNLKLLLGDSVRRIVMVVLRLSALRGWSVWMSLLLEWGLCVDHVLLGTLETLSSVMVSYFPVNKVTIAYKDI